MTFGYRLHRTSKSREKRPAWRRLDVATPFDARGAAASLARWRCVGRTVAGGVRFATGVVGVVVQRAAFSALPRLAGVGVAAPSVADCSSSWWPSPSRAVRFCCTGSGARPDPTNRAVNAPPRACPHQIPPKCPPFTEIVLAAAPRLLAQWHV